MQNSSIEVNAENVILDETSTLPLNVGNYIKVAVKDKDTGIAKETIPKIFDPFYTTEKNGHGLGLAASYSIIANHEGLLTVQSEFGVGSAFEIYLPALSERIKPPETSEERLFQKSERILVMDDEKDIRKIANRILTRQGYSVDTVKEGGEAIEMYIKAKESEQPYSVSMLFWT